MAPLIKELEARSEIESIVCVTAQHREMLDQMIIPLGIKPKHDLNIMKKGQSLADVTIGVLSEIDAVLKNERPDLVLVHGDTNTTFSTALSCFYNKIKVGHVEAGLRSFNKHEPFPEEIYRKIVSPIADINFAPTQTAKKYLLRESIDEQSIYVTGNTSTDFIRMTVKDNYRFKDDFLNKIDYKNKRIVTMTAHRSENLGEPLKNICSATLRLVEAFPDIEFVYPVHMNPLVRETVFGMLSGVPRIHLTEPLDPFEMPNLMNRSYLVFTDSGGLQEEAPTMNKPVVVLRAVTERPEGVASGTLILAGTEENDIFNRTADILRDRAVYDKMATAKNPFGDGFASKRIADAILYHFGVSKDRPEEFV